VVMGIIVIMTGLAIPAISKFLDGQTLTQSGRIVQSAFNEARRAAITQRSKNYLIFFRRPDDSRPGEFQYGMRRYREKVGYEGDAHMLLPGTMFDMDTGTGASSNPLVVAPLKALPVPLFEGLPSDIQNGVFSPGRVPVLAAGMIKWVEFLRDGTINLVGAGMLDLPPKIINSSSLFDLNVQFNGLDPTVFDTLRDEVDLSLREAAGAAEVDKRCFIDIDKNTGRVRVRVLEVGSQ
jgi:hypothetical protein